MSSFDRADPGAVDDEAPRDFAGARAFYDDHFAASRLAASEAAEAEAIADFVLTRLGLAHGARLFDQCCGVGRISLALARRGIDVVGVDQSAAYVEAATERAAREGLPCTFVCADAFDFVCDEPCDGAINWYTSFGFSDRREANVQMLRNVLHSLKPRAGFLLEMRSLPGMFARGRLYYVERFDEGSPDELLVVHENLPSFGDGVMNSRRTYVAADGTRTVRELRLPMLMPHDAASMAREAGFVAVEVLAPDGRTPLSHEDPRCLIVASRASQR